MTRARSRIALTLSAVLAAGTLAACEGLQLSINFAIPRRATDVVTQKIDMPAGARLVVHNTVGSTRVTVDSAVTQASVEITRIAVASSQPAADDLLSKIVVTVTPPSGADNTLTIDAPTPAEATSDESQFSIETRDDEVTVVSISGSIRVAQVQLRITLPPGHAADVTQTTGSVRAVALDTDSTLTTVTGSIRTIGCATKITAAAKTGSVRVDSHTGALDVETDTGSVDMEVLAIAAGQSILTRLGTGSIELTLPKNVDADLKALTETGHISFFKREFNDTSNVTQSRTSLTATLNDGGASVDLRTETGSIDISSR